MKEYHADQIRNFALVGHGGSGKTSLTESMLFLAKAINRLGKVVEGNTVSDHTEEEIKRNISISASLAHCEFRNFKLNIVDLPGYADFAGEVVSGMRVVDTALLVVDAFSGPEAGSESAFQLAEKYRLPLAVVINKIEKEHVKFAEVLAKTQESLSARALPVQYPIGEALSFKGFVDLIKMKGYEYADDGSVKELASIPADLISKCEEARGKLIEAIAEADDALLEKYFESGELTADEIRDGLKKAIFRRTLFPLFVTSATSNKGAIPLMEFATQYFPAPLDVAEINVLKGEKLITRKVGEDQPMLSLVFKTIVEKHVGELLLFRVYSGKVKTGEDVLNANRGVSEKIGQIFGVRGKERLDMGVAYAGDMGAFVKLRETHTGNTLCDKSDPAILPPIEFPEPTIEFAVKPASKGEEEKMAAGLTALRNEDPTFVVEVSAELKQTILHGQGELHLDVITSKLKDSYGIHVELEPPRIPYRETITKKTETQYRYKKQTGGRGQYGDVSLRLEPLPRGKGFEFVDAIVGGVIPNKFIPSVEKGIVEALHEGALSGHQVVDLRVTLFYGSYHTVDSSDMAFKIAGSVAFKNGFMECGPVLLEPIYDLEIIVPDENTGDIMGDMSSRRGKILGMEQAGKYERVKAQAPLAELFKYSTSLRSMTGGRGRHSQKFNHFESVPKEITEKIVAAHQVSRTEEK